jgi:hypothetical protein
MGVLKIKEDKDLYEQESLDLFSIDEPWNQEVITAPPVKRSRLKKGLIPILATTVLCVMVSSVVSFWNTSSGPHIDKQMPYAYMELRVIDGDGRPVAGARVKNGTRVLGVTDSFGEWHRFLRVKLGKPVTLTVKKSRGNRELSGKKTINVPKTLPAQGELELFASLAIGKPTQMGAAAVAMAAPVEIEPPATTEETLVETPEETLVKTPDPQTAMIGKDYSEIWVEVAPPATRPGTKIGKLQAEFLKNKVLGAIEYRIQELGIKIRKGAAWKLELRHLNIPGGIQEKMRGLIEVTSTHNGAYEYSFLRNYSKSSLPVARGILWGVTVHARKSYQAYKKDGQWLIHKPKSALWDLPPDHRLQNIENQLFEVALVPGKFQYYIRENKTPCKVSPCWLRNPGVDEVFPLDGYQPQTVRIFGATPQTKIYVAGYGARLKGDHIWAYHGIPNSPANVTAVNQGRVVFRGRVTGSVGKRSLLSIPSPAISRKP